MPRTTPTLLLLTAGLGLLATPALAAPQPVTTGSLTWTQTNVYDTGAPEGTDRTWLGYTTSIGPPFTNGTMTQEAPATGTAASPASTRGATSAFPTTYPVAKGGTYDPETGTGSIEFAGTLKYQSNAHGFAITVSNPLLVIAADRVQLFGTGTGAKGQGPTSSAGTPYDRSRPIFSLDRTTSRVEKVADGQSETGLAPAIATADMVWPGGSYPVGAGPDRTPNTFGTFAYDVHVAGASQAVDAPVVTPVAQPTATETLPAGTSSSSGKAPSKPSARCRATRTRGGKPTTTCVVRTDARRIVAYVGGRKVKQANAKQGVAVIVLPRKRQAVTFVATDLKGRELTRRTQTVGS